MYVLLVADHAATDGLGLLQCLSLMQENSYQRMMNSVAFPKRENYSSGQFIKSVGSWIKVIAPYDDKFDDIKETGMGEKPSANKDYHLSEDLNLI